MPKRVWNVAAGRYDMVPDGIQVGGTSFTDRQVISSKIDHFLAGKVTVAANKATALTAMLADCFSTATWKGVADEVILRVSAMMPSKATWQGKQGYREFAAVDATWKAALKNLIDNDNPAPGHDRGLHGTNPMNSVGAVTEIREYDLTAGQAGRVVRVIRQGVKAYYVSIHHAAATYQYYLVLVGDKPVLRGSIDPVNQVKLP
jgi:hypothetical protein